VSEPVPGVASIDLAHTPARLSIILRPGQPESPGSMIADGAEQGGRRFACPSGAKSEQLDCPSGSFRPIEGVPHVALKRRETGVFEFQIERLDPDRRFMRLPLKGNGRSRTLSLRLSALPSRSMASRQRFKPASSQMAEQEAADLSLPHAATGMDRASACGAVGWHVRQG
jgi:hypothetical protein